MITEVLKNFLLVGFGAMLGAMLRYAFLVSFHKPPLTIALINISGSFLLGVVAGVWASKDSPWRLFMATGLLGGYTTYSTFSMDVVEQVQNKQILPALANVSIQTVGSIALCFVGFAIGSRLSS